jgi:hypothetical protein
VATCYIITKWTISLESILIFLWIRIGFNENSGLSFYLNADPNPDPESRTIRIHVDPKPDPGQTFSSQKAEFLHEKYTIYC